MFTDSRSEHTLDLLKSLNILIFGSALRNEMTGSYA